MQTLSQIHEHEQATRQRAFLYEQLLGRRIGLTNSIARLGAEQKKRRESIANINKAEELIAQLPNDVQGLGGYMSRDMMLTHAAAMRAQYTHWLERDKPIFDGYAQDLKDVEAAIKEYE
jgi:hypothetical protein